MTFNKKYIYDVLNTKFTKNQKIMGISNQPIFELEMLIVKQALLKLGFSSEFIFAGDELGCFGITSDEFYPFIKGIDLTPLQGKEPMSEVTLEDVEFIFHDTCWSEMTVGALAAKLGTLVAYLKSLKDKDEIPEYVKNKERLENYKKSLGI